MSSRIGNISNTILFNDDCGEGIPIADRFFLLACSETHLEGTVPQFYCTKGVIQLRDYQILRSINRVQVLQSAYVANEEVCQVMRPRFASSFK